MLCRASLRSERPTKDNVGRSLLRQIPHKNQAKKTSDESLVFKRLLNE